MSEAADALLARYETLLRLVWRIAAMDPVPGDRCVFCSAQAVEKGVSVHEATCIWIECNKRNNYQ